MCTVRFIARNKKSDNKFDKRGLVPIDMVISVEGQKKFYRLKEKIFPANWEYSPRKQEAVFYNKDQAARRAKEFVAEQLQKRAENKAKNRLEDLGEEIKDFSNLHSVEEVKKINKNIRAAEDAVDEIVTQFKLNKTPYSSKMITAELIKRKTATPETKKEEKSDAVLEFIDEYIESHSSDRAKGSLNVYRHLKDRLGRMIKEKKLDITFESMDKNFLQKFQNFLTVDCGLSDATTAKQISSIRTILSEASGSGKKVNKNYKEFKKITVEDSLIIALTEQELDSLVKLDLSDNKSLDQVRDCFVFSCTAGGLRYSDLADLKREHINGDWINKICVKTKKPLNIPLKSPIAKAILNKYKDCDKPLPVISNQKMNQYLKGWTRTDEKGKTINYKGICERAGIVRSTEYIVYKGTKPQQSFHKKFELIGVHNARKTFVSLSSERGMTIKEIMEITGHKDYKSYEKYDNINLERQAKAMGKAWGEVSEEKTTKQGKTKLKAV